MPVTSYEQGSGEGTQQMYIATNTVHQVSFGLGYSQLIDIAAGVTIKHAIEKYADVSAHGNALDLGVLVRIPLTRREMVIDSTNNRFRASLSLGAAWGNYGPDVKFIEKSYPLPNTRRLGIGLEMTHAWWAVYPAAEWEAETVEGLDYWRFGTEVGAFGILALRGGYVSATTADLNETTYGFSISSLGITKRLVTGEANANAGFGKYLLGHLNVEFSFARIDSRGGLFADGVNYYGIEMSL